MAVGWTWKALEGWGEYFRIGVAGLVMTGVEWWSYEAGLLMSGIYTCVYSSGKRILSCFELGIHVRRYYAEQSH